jgi:hypothetical protein
MLIYGLAHESTYCERERERERELSTALREVETLPPISMSRGIRPRPPDNGEWRRTKPLFKGCSRRKAA